MEENRVPVFGKDAEEHEKRAFDWILVDGQPVVETKYNNVRIRTPLPRVLDGYKRLTQKQASSAND